MSAFQKSIWSSIEPSNIRHRPSLIEDFKKTSDDTHLSINVWSDETSEDGENNSKKTGSPYWFCCQCCIVGSLLAGIILAIVLTLWLTNSKATSLTLSTTISSTSTTSTTTTTTETTTTTTATIPTPAPPCGLAAPVSSNILLILTSSSPIYTVYTCYAFSWISSITKAVNLTFQFRHDTDSWNLDDVFVYRGATQLLVNGDFEMNSLLPWIRTAPSPTPCFITPSAQVVSPSRQFGSYHLRDTCKGQIDKISQQLSVNVGETYIVSFWLQTNAVASNMLVNVSIS